MEVVIVRYSEIAVKGRSTRARMESLLASNIREAIKKSGASADVRVMQGRIILTRPEPDALSVAEAAKRVFGVKSLSPAFHTDFGDLDDLVSKAADYFEGRVRGRIFRVRARRVGSHNFTSKDIEREVGSVLLERGASGVDLTNPEYTAYIEVRGKQAFFYDTVIPGPGGLPLGSEGPVLVLYSGGFDSTVAAWFVMRRGSPVTLAYYDLGHPKAFEIAVEAASLLSRMWAHGRPLRMLTIDFRGVSSLVREHVSPEYRTLVLRRLIALHSSQLAEKLGIEALATGENVGQVATQTIRNLSLIWRDIPLPVLRPVSGLDKDEITEFAREIGVYDVISRQIEVCGRDSSPTPHADIERFSEEFNKLRDSIESLSIGVEQVKL